VTYGWTLAATAALAIPWLIIRPAYPPPYPVGDRVPAAATPVMRGDFMGSVTLAGVELPVGPVGAGQGTRLTFYWRVQHPLPDGTWLFVHMVNDRGQTAAAFDGPPLYRSVTHWHCAIGGMVT